MFRASGIDREPGGRTSWWPSLGIEPVKRTAKPWQSALRPQHCLLSIHLKLRNIVASKLMLFGLVAEADFRLAENPVSG